MSEKVNNKKDKNYKRSPMFFIALLNFLIIVLLVIYIIYLRFIPYTTLVYDGYAVSGKEITNNLFDATFEVEENIPALKVSDQDMIYKNLRSYYVGASKTQNINLDYPLYINDNLALYNLNQEMSLITSDLEIVDGYKGFTLTSGSLYNSDTLERADYYEYILMKNSNNVYISCKEIKINTVLNDYVIPMNSIINFTDKFMTYYMLEGDYFVYGKIIDLDENSTVTIEDYQKVYTYKELMIALGVMKEEKPKTEIIVEDLTEEKKEQFKEEDKITEEVEEKTEENNNPNRWIKPEVKCTEFKPSSYIALNNVNISDPSKAICKAPTFTFYVHEEIAFRVSAASSGELKVTKLIPNTTYKVVGTYQYNNEEGQKVEATFLRQEFKTIGTENINSINLTFENGKKYSNKIELNNFGITSDIADEAIYGVSKATIELNGKEFKISSSNLKKILKGEFISYQTAENLLSNKKYDYEIKFYDTSEKEMKLNNNTGVYSTSKVAPTVNVDIKNESVVSIVANLSIKNEDKVNLSNYRYEMIKGTSSGGELYKSESLNDNAQKLIFTSLDPSHTYTMNFYADFDLEDGDGYLSNRLIGSTMFVTSDLSKLGKLKLDISYEEELLTDKQASLDVGVIFKEASDNILAQILNKFSIEIQEKDNIDNIRQVEFNEENLNLLKTGNKVRIDITNLESDKEYNILTKVVIKQGNEEKQISSTYTTRSFKTNKSAAEISVKNQVITTDMIDFTLIVNDKDGSVGEDGKRKVKIYLKEKLDELGNVKTINVKDVLIAKGNNEINLTYSGLTKGSTYLLSCEAVEYNETHTDNVKNNYPIKTKDGSETITFIADGLEGKIELNSLKKEKIDTSKNLINVKSENNWYSECFNTLNVDRKYNYLKSYNEENKTLTLKSNQCYVYDLREYGLSANDEITMSFTASVDNEDVDVYIQNSKKISEALLKDENGDNLNLEVTTSEKYYSYTFKIGEDGYVGFYLPNDIDGNAFIKELQIKKKEDADNNNAYEEFAYDLKTKMNLTLIEQQDSMQVGEYFVKIYNKKNNEEDAIVNVADNKEANLNINEELIYNLAEPNEETEYEIKLVIKAFGKEYVLDTISFTYVSEKCEEIKSIKTIQDFLDIQPNGNYIISQNLDLTNSNAKSEYTFGNENISFNGTIDFNGKTITKDTYSTKTSSDSTPYVFYKISDQAAIKNIVIDFKINNVTRKNYANVYDEDQKTQDNEQITEEEAKTRLEEEVNKGIYSLFLYNDGHISNVFLRLKQCTKISRNFVGLLGYTNNGTIDDFVIDLNEYDQNNNTVSLYGTQYIAGCCLYSSGVIQNGYVYGNGGIESYGAIADYGTRYFSGLVYKTLQNQDSEKKSIIQNVYNVANTKINYIEDSHENAFAANIVYKLSADTTLRNVYSTKEIIVNIGSEEIKKSVNVEQLPVENGPNVFRKYGNVENSFYFADTHYSNDNDIQGVRSSLSDINYQNDLLNEQNAFTAMEGYYPHLNMNLCMPNQDFITIEKGLIEIPIDILEAKTIQVEDISKDIDDAIQDTESKEALKARIMDNLKNYNFDGENIYLAEFKIYNPDGKNIDSIEVDYVRTNIIDQGYSAKKSIVFAVIDNPSTYYNLYNISKIISKDLVGEISETLFGESEPLGAKSIEMRFVKDITTKEEWNNIDQNDINSVSGLVQNYRLMNDLDFSDPGEGEPSIDGIFTGYIDGQEKTLSNISLGKPLFETLNGTLKNINIDGFTQTAFNKESDTTSTSKTCLGLIGDTESKAQVENIHLRNVVLNGEYENADCYIGGIIGYSRNKSLKNCSVSGIEVVVNNKMNTVSIGGLVGYSEIAIEITNCYAQNIAFDVTEVTTSNGIGGIIGRANAKANLAYCYTTGSIISDKQKIGGIYGALINDKSAVNYCYSMVNITSNASSGTLHLGGIGGYIETVANNKYTAYLGNIYVKKSDMNGVNRIVGNSTGTTTYNYAYNEQRINGILDTNAYGAKLISKDSKRDTSKKCTDLEMINGFSGEGKYFGTNLMNSEGYINDQYLPKLKKNVDSTEEMIWQEDMSIGVSLNITSLVTEYSEGSTSKAQITMVVENFEKVDITGFKIENMENISIVSNTTSEVGYTTVVFTATPTLYYDTYKLEKIYYKKDSKDEEYDVSAKIIKSFYKNISRWNYKEDGSGKWVEGFDTREGHEGQNYKITTGINLGSEYENDGYINTNISVGRLEADQKYTITGGNDSVEINLDTAESGLIKECLITLKNLTFKNIKIKANKNYIGLICNVKATCTDLTFENITVNGYSYVGIMSRILSGSVNNITLNKINCKGSSYVGGLCGNATLVGTNNKITATYTSAIGNSSYVGGLFGKTSGGTLNNLKAYQYSAEGKKDGDVETTYLAQGTDYVGGCIGLDNNTVYTAETKYSNIKGNSYVGGTIGYTNWILVKDIISEENKIQGSSEVGGTIGRAVYRINHIESKNNEVKATGNRVGGAIGYLNYSRIEGDGKISASNNTVESSGNYVGGVAGEVYAHYDTYDVKNMVSDNNKIISTKNYVGGVIGYARKNTHQIFRDMLSNNNTIRGVSYVGGIIGDTNGILKNLKTNNTTEISGVSYVGGIVGRQTYSNTNTSARYYSIEGVYVRNSNIIGTGSYVGGIAGHSTGTIHGAVVHRSSIKAGNSAGGIVGYYTGSTIATSSYVSCQTFYIRNSLCIDSEVMTTSNDNSGGIAGVLEYGNIQYCYVGNTNVSSTSYAAGGLVGYLKNSKTQAIQYISKITNNYIANTSNGKMVSANNQVGGLIGKMDRVIEADSSKDTENRQDTYLENAYGANLIVTNIKCSVTDAQISMGIGNGSRLGSKNQNENMFNTYVYYRNCIITNNSSVYVQNASEKSSYTYVNYNWLTTANNYSNSSKLNLNGKFDINMISSKKFPTLIPHSTWVGLEFIQNGIDLPEEPVATNTSSVPMTMSLAYEDEELSAKELLPEVYVYPVDVDKINIEFDKINESSNVTVMAEDGTILINDYIKERVYSLEYDFNTPIIIRVSSGTIWQNIEYKPEDLRNKLDINEDEYLYLIDGKLYSNKREFDGQYVNIYDNKVLSIDGKVYDISNMGQEIKTIKEVMLLEEQIPIVEYTHNNKTINTFYHSTKITDTDGISTFKDKQMFIKNSSLYVLDGSLQIVGNAIIVDSYNDNQYEAVLGVDGRIYNFLTDIKYPTGFKNQDIISMTNNINNSSNVVLVYYSSGKVYGFNYITGEEVFDNGLGKMSLSEYISESLDLENMLYNIEESNYEAEKELAKKLEKVSISEAIQNIESSEILSEQSSNDNLSQDYEENSIINNTSSNTNIQSSDLQYVISYDTSKQSYVVYSSEELFDIKSQEVVSENEKIEANAKLENYYGNLSVSKIEVKNIGVILFIVAIVSIGIILIIMRKKSIK